MEKVSIISINITSFIDNNYILLNKKEFPILFYYNYSNDEDLFNELKNNSSFIQYIQDICCNINYYTNSKINLIYFTEVNKKDSYKEFSKDVQNFISLEDLDNTFYLDYILEISKDLYNKAFHKEYKSDFDSSIDIIVDIYNQIQNNFPNKFVKSTTLNYFRKQLKDLYTLQSNNVEYLINTLDNKFS